MSTRRSRLKPHLVSACPALDARSREQRRGHRLSTTRVSSGRTRCRPTLLSVYACSALYSDLDLSTAAAIRCSRAVPVALSVCWTPGNGSGSSSGAGLARCEDTAWSSARATVK
jgi:hypothetical protein